MDPMNLSEEDVKYIDDALNYDNEDDDSFTSFIENELVCIDELLESVSEQEDKDKVLIERKKLVEIQELVKQKPIDFPKIEGLIDSYNRYLLTNDGKLFDVSKDVFEDGHGTSIIKTTMKLSLKMLQCSN